MRGLCSAARTVFFQTLLPVVVAVAAASATQAAPVRAGKVFEPSSRHIRYGAELPSIRREVRSADGRSTGRLGGTSLGRVAQGELAVPEPGAALLFGLGALVIARRRRRRA
jgi:hypothetical protein